MGIFSPKPITLPLTKGNGKDARTGDYVSLLPVNMLTVRPGEVIDSGYMRSFPGITKRADVAGTSRGAKFNESDGLVYRVCGETLYKADTALAQIPGYYRISMAGSNKSLAVAANGTLNFYQYDGQINALTNWPSQRSYSGKTNVLESNTKTAGYSGSLTLTISMTDAGRIQLTITPIASTGAQGADLVINTTDLNKQVDQVQPASGTPYLTAVKVSGFAIAGTTLTVAYTFNLNGAGGVDASSFTWRQIIEPTTIQTAQYDLGTVADVTHANGRYAWLKAGSNTFGVTDLSDETKPDQYRPFMTAESIPDPALAIDTLNGDIVMFGTKSTEFFTLTGSANTSQPIYKSQRAMLIPIGIAGVHSKVIIGSQFAILSHPATGNVTVYMIGGGRYTEIANRQVTKALANMTPAQISAALLEYLTFDGHKLLIIRAGAFVFCYDMTSNNWSQLCTGINEAPHTAIDFIYDGQHITAADTANAVMGNLDRNTRGQYGKEQECILYTPMLSAAGLSLFDFELETAGGNADTVEHLALSATVDGVTYGPESSLITNGPQRYTGRTLKKQLGYVRKNIGFKLRTLAMSPFTASTAKVRPG